MVRLGPATEVPPLTTCHSVCYLAWSDGADVWTASNQDIRRYLRLPYWKTRIGARKCQWQRCNIGGRPFPPTEPSNSGTTPTMYHEYSCQVCGRGYKTDGDMKRHMGQNFGTWRHQLITNIISWFFAVTRSKILQPIGTVIQKRRDLLLKALLLICGIRRRRGR